MEQNNELKEGIDKLASNDQAAWIELTNWDIPGAFLKPRQDNIPNGIEPRYTKLELAQNTGGSNFIPTKFYDLNQYLSNLILLAHTVDDDFQKSVQQIFSITE